MYLRPEFAPYIAEATNHYVRAAAIAPRLVHKHGEFRRDQRTTLRVLRDAVERHDHVGTAVLDDAVRFGLRPLPEHDHVERLPGSDEDGTHSLGQRHHGDKYRH